MKIERVDENTIKCYISGEELQEYDIDYKDFLTRSDKAKELVHEVMHQAEEEVGFKPPPFAFDLQIMMLPDRGVILTLSEEEPDMSDKERLMEYLNDMKRSLLKTKDALNDIASDTDSRPTAKPSAKPPAFAGFAVFVFSGLGKVMEYAAVLPSNLRVESALYKMDNYYFLYFLKGHASQTRYSRACVQALEFASLYAAEESHAIYLKEHGECLIAEKAIRKLRG